LATKDYHSLGNYGTKMQFNSFKDDLSLEVQKGGEEKGDGGTLGDYRDKNNTPLIKQKEKEEP